MPKAMTEAQIRTHLQTLTTTPPRIAACTHGIVESQLAAAPAPDAWSAVDILAHLRGCADVWSASIYTMLVLDNPELPYIHPRDWTAMQQYATLSFEENLRAFQIGRDNLVRVLAGLSPAQWERAARVQGKANTYTVAGETRRMALHELEHCQQLETMFLPGGATE